MRYFLEKWGWYKNPVTDEERERIIKKFGGYVSIDDVLARLQDKDFVERNKILTQAVKRSFNTICDEDILKQRKDGAWMYEGKVLPDGVQKQLIAEASHFVNTKLWKVLQADVKYQANRKMFLQATDVMQIAAGKLWLYTLDCLHTRLESLAKGSSIFHK